jgi:hypothetical protein
VAAGLFGKAAAPIVWMTAVVLECENTNSIGQHTIVNGVGETGHEVDTDSSLRNPPPLGGNYDGGNSVINRIEELRAKPGTRRS